MYEISPELLSSLACSQCRGALTLTRESILVCTHCLVGYRVRDGVPDLRADKLVVLSNRSQADESLSKIELVVLQGDEEGRTITLKNDCCVVLGRLDGMSDDTTFVGKPEERAPLDRSLWPYVQKYLTTQRDDTNSTLFMPSSLSGAHTLGDFRREPDELFDVENLSRCHALLYQADGVLRVMDLVSRTGTFVNGREVEHVILMAGDEVRLDSVIMKVQAK